MLVELFLAESIEPELLLWMVHGPWSTEFDRHPAPSISTKGVLEYHCLMNKHGAREELQAGTIVRFNFGFNSGVLNKAQS